MPFREPTIPRRPASIGGLKGRIAGAFLGAAAASQSLEACTFGPPAPSTYNLGGPQTEEGVRNKFNEPRYREFAQEFARLPQIELAHLQEEAQASDADLATILQRLNDGAIEANAFLSTSQSPGNTARLGGNMLRMQEADRARNHVAPAHLIRYFAMVRQHAQTDFRPDSADRLVSVMARGLRLITHELVANRTSVDRLQPFLGPEERNFIASYLTNQLADRQTDAELRRAVEQAGNAFRVTSDLPRQILVVLTEQALQDGPLFALIRNEVERLGPTSQAGTLLARSIPAMRAGIISAAIVARERDHGAPREETAPTTTPYDEEARAPSGTASPRRHRHHRH